MFAPKKQRNEPDFAILTDRFATEFRSTLSKLTRSIVDIKMQAPRVTTYEDALEIVADGGHLSLIKMSPLGGQSLLIISPKLSASFVEALMGSAPKTTPKTTSKTIQETPAQIHKEPTPLENRILEKFTTRALADFHKYLEKYIPCTMTISGHETHPRFVTTHLASDQCMYMAFNVEGTPLAGEFGFILPYSIISSYLRNHKAAIFQKPDFSSPLGQTLLNTAVNVTAKVGETVMNVNDIINLAPGDIIALTKKPGDPVEILVEGIPKFKAEIVQKNGKLALKIIQVITQSKQSKQFKKTG